MTPNEMIDRRVNQLENQLKNYLVRFNHYEAALDKAASFDSKLDEMKGKLSDVEITAKRSAEENTRIVSDKLNVSHRDLSNEIVGIKKTMDSRIYNDQKTENSLSSFAHDFVRINMALKYFDKQLENVVKNQDFYEMKSKFLGEIARIDLEANEIRTNSGKIASFIYELEKSLNDTKTSISNLITLVNDKYKQQGDVIVEVISNVRREITSQFNSSIKISSDTIKQELSNLPKPIVSNSDELKQEMSKNLEPIALDSRNANLRSSNVEAKLNILEKKIEQLTLLIQKISLNGGVK